MATRTTPTTGTDRQRLATAVAGKFLAEEVHTTKDHGRAWMGGTRPLTGAVYLGTVATEAAMLALFASGAKARGCFEGDDCYRSDTLSWWKCIANNGKLIGEWQEMSAAVGTVAAVDVTYDPTASGLTATDVQAAIDEIQAEIDALPSPGTGTVTSVDLTVPSFLAVTGNPITSTGTLAVSLATQNPNKAFLGPASGADAAPTFRSLVSADFPALLAAFSNLTNAAGKLTNDGSGNLSWASSSSTPAGSNTQIQFNNSGAMGASADLTWSGSTAGLTISGNSLAGANPTLKITDSNASQPVWARVEQTSVNAAFEFGVAGASGQFFGDAHAGDGIFKGFLASPGMAIGGGASSPLTSLYVKYGGVGAKGRVIIGGVIDDGTNDLQVLDNAFIKNSLKIGNGSGAGPFLQINSSTYTLLQYARGGASKFSTGTANSTNDFITGTVQDDIAFKSDASKSIHFSTDNGSSASLKLVASTGKAVFGNSIKTSAPSSGTADEWKLGSLQTNYAEADIAGTAVKLAISTRVLLPLFDHYADVGNTSTTETDLYSDTIAASQFGANGDKVELKAGGVFVSSATATRQVKLYFGGTAIFDTGALTLSLSAAWTMFAVLIRVSSTVVRYTVSFTTEGAALAAYTATGELTGLTLSSTNVCKITGTAAGVGAATNDIVAKLGAISFIPAA